MQSRKFDKIDRKRVIRALEDHYKIKLSEVGRRLKWLQDEEKRNYWVIGGYGEWHGIPEEMMNAEIDSPTEGILVIAARRKASMDIFVGGVDALVKGREKLYRARKTTRDYQFTYTIRGSHLFINQLPTVSLEKIEELPYEAKEKENDKKTEDIKKLLEGMSKEERAKVIKSLKNK